MFLWKHQVTLRLELLTGLTIAKKDFSNFGEARREKQLLIVNEYTLWFWEVALFKAHVDICLRNSFNAYHDQSKFKIFRGNCEEICFPEQVLHKELFLCIMLRVVPSLGSFLAYLNARARMTIVTYKRRVLYITKAFVFIYCHGRL